MLSVAEAEEIIERVANLEGGGWRLPTVKVVLTTLNQTLIKKPFLTRLQVHIGLADQSFYSKRYQWSVK